MTKYSELLAEMFNYHTAWGLRGKWADPTPEHSIMFVVSEVDELEKAQTLREIATESFDVWMMAQITGRLYGLELTEKPQDMPLGSLKRQLWQADIFTLINAHLRLATHYTRNNDAPGGLIALQTILEEIAGKAVTIATKAGFDFEAIGREKLARMEVKRQ